MVDSSATESWHESVHRIEDAPSGLAYVMRQHDALFYKERGSVYVIDVPKRTRSGNVIIAYARNGSSVKKRSN